MKSRRAARGSALPEVATERPPASVLFARLAVMAIAVAVIVAYTGHLHPFFIDQNLVALRYADRFHHGHGLTWTDGGPIEGYSSLLWVLATAAVSSFGIDPLRAAWIVGIASTVAAVPAVLWRRRALRPIQLVGGGFAALVIACSGPFNAWSISAAEATLVAALLAWAVALLLPLLERDSIPAPALIPSGLLLALLAITRPEGVVFGVAAAAGLWAVRQRVPEAMALVTWPAAAFVAQSVFRVAYYGEWLPSPVREQLGMSGGRLLGGVIYVVDAIPTIAPVLIVAIVAGLWVRRLAANPIETAPAVATDRGAIRLLLVMLVVWLICVVAMGGDDQPARRFVIPAVVLLAFIAAHALERAQSRGAAPGGLVLLAGIALAIYVPLQLFDPAVRHARDGEVALQEAEAVGRMLGSGFRPMYARIALDQPGAIPFISKLPAIDMSGTNERHLASLPIDSVRALTPGDGTIGEYLMSREPDLILFRNPAGGDTAWYRGGLEMRAHPRFLDRYSIVNFQTPEPYKTRSRIWMRRDGGPLGIEITPNRIVIPGWHIMADPASTVRLDALGHAGVTVRPERVTGVTDVTLTPGVWVVSLDADLPGVNVWIRDSATEAVLAQAPDRVGIRFGGGTVDIALQSDLDELVIVRRMVIEKRE